jgi:hypothetical protein
MSGWIASKIISIVSNVAHALTCITGAADKSCDNVLKFLRRFSNMRTLINTTGTFRNCPAVARRPLHFIGFCLLLIDQRT